MGGFVYLLPREYNRVLMASGRCILMAGGGSGGHLYPGLAVAEELVRIDPSVRPVFLCTTREIDTTILKPTGFEFVPQSIVPPRKSIGGLIRFWRGWRDTQEQVRKVIAVNKPAAVLGLGGYAAGPAVKLAARAGVSAAIINPDVIPGKANQYLFRYIRHAYCQFESTRDHVPASVRDKLQVVGCPIRADILNRTARDEACLKLGLQPNLSTLVVTGASQGAVTVNEAATESLKQIITARPDRQLQGWQILHLSGKDNADAVRAEYREMDVPAIVLDFTPAMSDVWATADLAISRAGASSCAELTACGVPSLLMPYPFHKDKHQLANAKVLESAGAAVVIDDAKDRAVNAGLLRPVLESLLYDATRRAGMSEAARRLARPDAAGRVAALLMSLFA
jgi:UDP-N-acetylglucosamine--N-acetylmuramyl-(pentapeptide) pyrophosphoryl-undecaprenol N-acetylglucosamine transferase